MKILKKATQKNVLLDKDYYTPANINMMLANNEIFYFDEYGNQQNVTVLGYEFDMYQFRIFTEKLSEIKVVLDDGFYANVAIGKNGETYHVEL